MAKACSECDGSGWVPDRIPCPTCKGSGFILDENKKLKNCPGGCDWGRIETGTLVICSNCKGTGKEPDLF